MSLGNHRRSALVGLLVICFPAMVGNLGSRQNFNDRILAAQNEERATMGLAPLRWNSELSDGAKQWSDHLAQTGTFYHSPDEPDQPRLGENIWGGTPDAYTPEAMVGLWIDEKRDFQPGVFPSNSKSDRITEVAHYTQLMWRSTNQVGCALSRGRKEEILVCRYSKPGNIIGQRVF